MGNPYGSNKGVSIWDWPYRAIPHGTHIGLLSGPHMGILWAAHMGLFVCASPYTCHTGPIWACYLGPTWVLYGYSHMGMSVWGPFECVYMGTRKYPILGPNRLTIWAQMGHVWACPYVLDRMGPIWVFYGRPQMGNSYTSHTIGVFICSCPHSTHMGPIWACPYGHGRIGPSHKGPISVCYLSPTWVLMGVPIWA